jgi:hypothetical protein
MFEKCYIILDICYNIHTFWSSIRLMRVFSIPISRLMTAIMRISLANVNPHAHMRSMTAIAAMMTIISRMNPDADADMDLDWSCPCHVRRSELSNSQGQSAANEEFDCYSMFHCIIILSLNDDIFSKEQLG